MKVEPLVAIWGGLIIAVLFVTSLLVFEGAWQFGAMTGSPEGDLWKPITLLIAVGALCSFVIGGFYVIRRVVASQRILRDPAHQQADLELRNDSLLSPTLALIAYAGLACFVAGFSVYDVVPGCLQATLAVACVVAPYVLAVLLCRRAPQVTVRQQQAPTSSSTPA